MSDLDKEELIATRKLNGLDDNLFKKINTEDNIKRCEQLTKPEHANWIGISNQMAIAGVLARIKELEEECNKKNKTIETMRYIKGINNQENIYLLDESMCIERNKYLLEVNNGEFVDVNELYRMCKNSIPVQKVKDKIEEYKIQKNKYESETQEIFANNYYNRKTLELTYRICALEELLEEK